MAYTPGVARVCMAIAEDPSKRVEPDDQAEHGRGRHRRHGGARAGRHRARGRDAGDGGQGDALQGVRRRRRLADLPRHEGPRRDRRRRSTAIAPGFGGINLEDISAPRCFEIERRLRASLDIPVFHDDQHGTAIVVLAAFLNALRVVEQALEDVKVVVTGVGAAGIAVTEELLAAGVRTIIGCDRIGAIYRGRDGSDRGQGRVRRDDESRRASPAPLAEALAGADVFIGLSQPGAVTSRGIASMATRRDRVRDGEPDARGRARGDRGLRRRDRDRTLGLSEPDQQRARVPRHLPRRPRRARRDDHRVDEVAAGHAIAAIVEPRS